MIPKVANTDLRNTVAANLKRFRQNLHISQEQLADTCGYHRTYIGAIERGERNITLATLSSLATALNVSPSEMLSTHEE
ncbi:helix-turn-helix domain-containing protein [Rhizobium leguminosarum]|uniref:helix-turn-helix domain-containing protein n=1 Tax=Rhizobium leguminosarum TaxID=384 RepID=UPI003F9483A4